MLHWGSPIGDYGWSIMQEKFLESVKHFTVPEWTECSMIFKVFMNSKDESDAVYTMNHIKSNTKNLLGK